MISWEHIISGLIALSTAGGVGLVTSLLARKSQAEANKLTGTNNVTERYDGLTNQLQEERDHAKADIDKLRADFEDFKRSVQSQFSQYRAYIHRLRGQVHDLGGTPIEWPQDLDQ